MQEGDSNPERDSAAKAASRASAISAALEADYSSETDDYATDYSAPVTTGNDDTVATPSRDAEAELVPSDGASEGHQDQAAPPSAQLQAPKEWPQDRRKEFEALPDAAKRILLDRNKEFTNGIRQKSEEYADHRKRSEAITELLKPYDADLQNSGMDHVGAVRFMVQEREAFNRDPAGFLLGYMRQQSADPAKFIQHLAERAGLTQDQLPGGKTPPAQTSEPDQATDEWVDPMVLKLQEHIQALEGKLNASQQQLSQFATQHSEREALTIQEEIQAFRSATDDAGNPLRPHYDALIPFMQQLMNTDPQIARIPDWKAQEKLQKAYEKAIWLHDDTRNSFIDTQVNQKLSEQMSQQSLDRAKAAATKRGSPGANGHAQPGKMSRADAVAAALRETGHA